MKTCSTCKTAKPTAEFYEDARRKDGLKSQCRQCHCASTVLSRDPVKHANSRREHMRRARAKDPEKFRARDRGRKRGGPEVAARSILNSAAKSGRLVRPDACSRCLVACRPHGHHTDYTRPLDVVWLCSQCHGEAHRTFRRVDVDAKARAA